MRINRFTDQELLEITANINTPRTELEASDIKFVMMIAPDKEEIYGEDYKPPDLPTS